jgi:peptidoglycan lytic transglycosylase F
MRASTTTVIVVAALGAATASRPADVLELKQPGTLRVLVARQNGGVVSRSPFFGLEPGAPTGFDRDVLERFAKGHGLKIEPVVVDGYDQLVPDLLADKGDVIAGSFTDTEGRRKLISFTAEVLPTRNVVLTRKPHRVVSTLEQLRAERVGATKGTAQREAVAVAGVPAANVDDSVPIAGLPEALRKGQINAAIMEVFAALESQRRDPDLQVGMFLGPPRSLAFGVRKDQPQLRLALNNYIEGARQTSLWYQLLLKYFGQSGPEMLRRSREGKSPS